MISTEPCFSLLCCLQCFDSLFKVAGILAHVASGPSAEDAVAYLSALTSLAHLWARSLAMPLALPRRTRLGRPGWSEKGPGWAGNVAALQKLRLRAGSRRFHFAPSLYTATAALSAAGRARLLDIEFRGMRGGGMKFEDQGWCGAHVRHKPAGN